MGGSIGVGGGLMEAMGANGDGGNRLTPSPLAPSAFPSAYRLPSIGRLGTGPIRRLGRSCQGGRGRSIAPVPVGPSVPSVTHRTSLSVAPICPPSIRPSSRFNATQPIQRPISCNWACFLQERCRHDYNMQSEYRGVRINRTTSFRRAIQCFQSDLYRLPCARHLRTT